MKISKLTVTLLIVIVVLAVYAFFFKGNTNQPDKYDKQKRDIDSLTLIIGGLERNQRGQDLVIKSCRDSISVLDHQLDSTKQKIIDIRKYYNGKIKVISNYTPAELNSFFSDRYK